MYVCMYVCMFIYIYIYKYVYIYACLYPNSFISGSSVFPVFHAICYCMWLLAFLQYPSAQSKTAMLSPDDLTTLF